MACWSILQFVAVHCSAFQCISVHFSALQCIVVRCSALQCVAMRCSVLQCFVGCCSIMLQYLLGIAFAGDAFLFVVEMHVIKSRQHTATRCNALKHTTKRSTILLRTATHCNMDVINCSLLQQRHEALNMLTLMQHTATRCRELLHTLQHITTWMSLKQKRQAAMNQRHMCNTLPHSATYCNTLQHECR